MKGKSLTVAIAGLVAILVVGGLIYTKKQALNTTQEATSSTGTGTAQSVPSTETASTAAPQSNLNPDLSLDASGLSKATVTIMTTKGPIKYRFYPKDAPITVKRIVELINAKFYNGLTFHRVEPGFVIQGGDPNGNGTGGSGQNINAEFNERKHTEGAVAMARAMDPNSADSQFYITLAVTPHLDRNYTVFGQVVEGMDVVKKIQVGDKMVWLAIE